jgi:signal transduction histidine kinase
MINTVLRNLLSNAIKFTNPKGQIQISAQRTEGNTRVSITDNGIGIDPLKLAQLFVVSHKTSTQGTAQESGTGLGLPICKELIEIHGGEIWAKSKPNEGSKFTFTLPKTLKFTPQKLD